MIIFIAQGAALISSPTASVILISQSSSWSRVLALGVGNEPITPALQLAITISGPDNKNIGA